MLNPHTLNGPEITTLLAALGLVVNATISFCMMKKSAHRASPRSLQPARANLRRGGNLI